MGPKVTIDSATLMNKGLEVIEAFHLFALKPDEIDVVVHAQSVIHGLVEFRDGSFIAQLGSPDMRIPIAHCLAWPERIDGPAPRLDLAQVATLTFERPDLVRFPALGLGARRPWRRAAAPRRYSMPRMRWRSASFSPKGLDLWEYRPWSRRPSPPPSGAGSRGNRRASTMHSPLTMIQDC